MMIHDKSELINQALDAKEQERLNELLCYTTLDTHPEDTFGDLVKLAAQICDVPVSLISLLTHDRQLFKAAFGTDRKEMPLDMALCSFAMLEEELLEVEDVTRDARFQKANLSFDEKKICFYVGIVLKSPSGLPLGTLCLIDTVPRVLTEAQRFALKILARQVMTQFELRRLSMEENTARMAAEADNKAKSDFFASINHEIRTPLNAIIGIGNILAIAPNMDDRTRMLIKTLQTSANGMLTLVNDLLDVGKIEAGYLRVGHESFNLETVVHDVVAMLHPRAHQKLIDLTYDIDCDEGCYYVGDGERMKQVLLNLCSNAVKFTEKGQVEILVRRKALDDTTQDHVTITVRDSGIGIPQDRLERIFEKYRQADDTVAHRYGGTGLGLSITRMIVEALGGTISVASTVGAGSSFSVALPMEREIIPKSKAA